MGALGVRLQSPVDCILEGNQGPEPAQVPTPPSSGISCVDGEAPSRQRAESRPQDQGAEIGPTCEGRKQGAVELSPATPPPRDRLPQVKLQKGPQLLRSPGRGAVLQAHWQLCVTPPPPATAFCWCGSPRGCSPSAHMLPEQAVRISGDRTETKDLGTAQCRGRQT